MKPQLGPAAAWTVSQLLERRVDPTFRVTVPSTVPRAVIDRLTPLSVDGLLKTLWFLGHCVGDFATCGSGHGRTIPTITEADRIIERAFTLLGDWPHPFAQLLTEYSGRRPSPSRAALLNRLHGPIKSYLDAALEGPEFSFLRCAYEQVVRSIWRDFGRAHALRGSDRQREFDFG